MSGGSWNAFATNLADENTALAELGAAALAMTSALVSGSVAQIEAAERDVDARRIVHAQAHVRRAEMMRRGFGDLALPEVCAYAPRSIRRTLYATLRDMRVRAIALRITLGNNKALIAAGLARISRTIAVMQKHSAESTGTYRRRGLNAPANGSLIVSRRA